MIINDFSAISGEKGQTMKIQRLIDYLACRAPRKRALEDKEKALKAYREEKNCLMTENDFLKKEKDVLEGEKNKQYQTIQELLGEKKELKEQIEHLVQKANRLEIRLEASTQRADGLFKEVESWKAAALRNDETAKALKEAKEGAFNAEKRAGEIALERDRLCEALSDYEKADQKKKRKATLPGRVIGKGKGIKSTGATGAGVKLNKQ